MRLSTGTDLVLEPGADLMVAEAGATERFTLARGALRARVAKLRGDQRFIVATPDADVEVRGTAFRLSVEPADTSCGAESSVTRLAVSEGMVIVRHGGQVMAIGAGEHWPRCEERERAVVTATPAVPVPAPRPAVLVRRAAAPRPHAPTVETAPAPEPARAPPPVVAATPPPPMAVEVAAPSSTLGYENDLYARALAARKAGDRERALATFQELERRFPASLLREPSLVERMRLAASADPGEAAALAREYLTRFPRGTARGEAAALLAGSRRRSGAAPPP
jgi:hypothetical protein